MSSLPSAPFGTASFRPCLQASAWHGNLPIKTVLFAPGEIVDSVYFRSTGAMYAVTSGMFG